MRILLVEDDVLLAKGTATLIAKMGGHEVRVTADPQDVVSSCQTGEVDAVMMDVNLPGAEWLGEQVSGADLCRWLKTQPDTSHIPVVLVTAYAMRTERESLLGTSLADEFFAKPVTDYNRLLDTFDRLISSAPHP